MNNYRAFTVTYLGATNTKGSRIKIKDERFKKSIIIQYNYCCNNMIEMAEAYLNQLGIVIMGRAEIEQGYILFTKDFETELKK